MRYLAFSSSNLYGIIHNDVAQVVYNKILNPKQAKESSCDY